MSGRNSSASGNILVIGYGNTLRGDDAVGQHVALAVSDWSVPGLTALAVHQLTSDLAEPLSTAQLAILVDARLAAEGDFVELHPLEPSTFVGLAAHASNPRGLLALALAVYGRHAPAWLVSVPAVDFSLREGLSATATRGAEDALAQIAALIGIKDR